MCVAMISSMIHRALALLTVFIFLNEVRCYDSLFFLSKYSLIAGRFIFPIIHQENDTRKPSVFGDSHVNSILN